VSSSALVIKQFAVGDDPAPSNVTLLGPIKYKLSTPTDVIATFHTECLLLTKSKTPSGGGSGKSAAKLIAGIEIAPDVDGAPGAWQPVPVSGNDDGSNADVNEFGTFIGDDPGIGKVFMCSRWQKVTFDLGTPETHELDDFIEVWTETRQAHGFQWAIINPVQEPGFSNTFWIRIRGTLDTEADVGSEASVAVAKRLLYLEPVKLHQVITQ